MNIFRMPMEPALNQEDVPEGYTQYRLNNNGSPGTFAGSHSSHFVLGHDACGNLVASIEAHEKCCPAKLVKSQAALRLRSAGRRVRAAKRELPPY
jgi:hypothetical protein